MTIKADKRFTPAYQKTAGSPSEEQLKAINAFALAPLAAEQVYVRTAYLAHNAIDRDGEVFDDTVLDDFARTLPGKGLFVKHPRGWDGDSGPGTGRWFAARTVTMGLEEARAALREPGLRWPASTQQAKLLEASYYIPRLGKNADLIAETDAGVAGDVSIGFCAADRTAINDESGNRLALRILGPGEALEGSLVWLGAQPGARVVKNADRTNNPTEDDMDLKQLNEELKAKLADAQKKAEAFEAIVKAVGEAFATNVALLARAVNDGKAFRADLIDRIVKAERLAGIVTGDDEATVKAAKELHAESAIERLQAYLARVEKMAGAGGKGQIGGGDPNTTGADPAGAQVKDGPLAEFANNPLLGGGAVENKAAA